MVFLPISLSALTLSLYVWEVAFRSDAYPPPDAGSLVAAAGLAGIAVMFAVLPSIILGRTQPDRKRNV